MSPGRSAGAVLVLALLLAGCGGSPEADLRDAVAGATTAANQRDADGLRSQARHLAELARSQRSRLGAARSDRVQALAAALDADADGIDPAFLKAQEAARQAAQQQAAQQQAAQQAARDAAAREQAARDAAAQHHDGEDGKDKPDKGKGKAKGKD